MPLPKEALGKQRRAHVDYGSFWTICDEQVIEYCGNGRYMYTGDCEGQPYGLEAQIRTIDPLDSTNPLAMTQFELVIDKTGLSNTITIGVCDDAYPKQRYLPGWKAALGVSIGVDACEGKLYNNSNTGEAQYAVCSEGDVMKCAVVPSSEDGMVCVEFYRNDVKLTQVATRLPHGGFYGVVGLASTGEEIVISPPTREEVESFDNLFELKSDFISHKGDGVCSYKHPSPLSYIPTVSDESEPAFNIGTLRSRAPVNPSGPSNRLSIKLIDPGESCAIVMGLCGQDYPVDCMPGWKEDSVGYHADIASILYGEEKDKVASWSADEVLQCEVEPIDGSTKQVRVVYRKSNDIIIGKTKLWCPVGGLYWCVGLMSRNETIQICLPRKSIPLSIPKLPFEDVWLMGSSSIEYVSDGICSYVGLGRVEHLGVVRSKDPINALSYFPFFEVKIVNPGESKQIAVGVCTRDYPLNAMPGWKNKAKSIGFHCDSGSVYQDSDDGDPVGIQCEQGDVIRCSLEPVDGSDKQIRISFHLNGALVESVIDWRPRDGFFAQIGMMSRKEVIQIASPFMRPSVLKQGLEGIDPKLTKLAESHKRVIHTAPVKRTVPNSRSPTHFSKLTSYQYQPPSISSDALFQHSASDQDYLVHSRRKDSETEDLKAPPLSMSPKPHSVSPLPLFPTPTPPHPPQEVTVPVVPKSVNKLYRSFYNVLKNDAGNIECISREECGYVVCRKSLSENMSYFEVGLVKIGTKGVSVGVSSGKNVPASATLGTFPTSAAFLSTGVIYSSTPTGRPTDKHFKEGDTLGCKVSIASTPATDENKNLYYPKIATVSFYRNAVEVDQVELTLAQGSLSLYPTVCILEEGTCVALKYQYKLKPEDFFDDHPIPEDYLNFLNPDTVMSWKAVQNCSIAVGLQSSCIILEEGTDGAKTSEAPAIAQHHIPFSSSNCYFEVELMSPASAFSLLAVGAMPKVPDDDDAFKLPGEVVGSVGYMPLAGLLMRNNDVTSYIRDDVTQLFNNSQGGVRVGIGVDVALSTLQSLLFFFTYNKREIAQLVCPVNTCSVFPTVAIVPHSQKLIKQLCNVTFPSPWPVFDASYGPLGVAEMSSDLVFNYDYILKVHEEDKALVRGFQGCYPLSSSRSYYEATILSLGDNYKISIGLASLMQSLDRLVGENKHSIAYHVNSGCVVHESFITATMVRTTKGLSVGCGAVFPTDGSKGSAEVYFTVNKAIVFSQYIELPPSGLFPTITTNSSGSLINVNLACCSPMPVLPFKTKWLTLDNIQASGATLQLISHAHLGMAQLAEIITSTSSLYFSISLRHYAKTGKILIGLSNTMDSPLSSYKTPSERYASYYLEVTSGTIIVCSQGTRKSDECLLPVDTSEREFGCGIRPIPHSNHMLVYFTANNQMVYALKTDLLNVELHPVICMIGTKDKMYVNTCALWPPVTPIGTGWARWRNIRHTNGTLTQETQTTSTFDRNPIGFAQTCTPLLPGDAYFEVEIMSRSKEKAIAIGLASKTYSMSQWIGWSQGSIAYHADDGHLFKADGRGIKFGPQLVKGDVVGCGIKFSNGEDENMATKGNIRVEVFFTVNQSLIKQPQPMVIPEGGLFPAVCIESPTESVCVNFNSKFPMDGQLASNTWARLHLVSEAGYVLEHCFRGRSDKGSPAAYCQAKQHMSQSYNYFEISLLEEGHTYIAMGLAPLQPFGSDKVATCLVFNTSGQILASNADSNPNITSTRQKCDVGDKLGCMARFTSCGKLTTITFYHNNMLVMNTPIPDFLINQLLYPTIIMSHPNDVVMPLLHAPTPSSQLTYIGWLRSERVKFIGKVMQYHPTVTKHNASDKVGVAQVSQSVNARTFSYYEIEVLDIGVKGRLSIGLGAVNHPLSSQPGWVSGSVGYHGDDGCLFKVSGSGVGFGPPWKKYDVIGLGIRCYEGNANPGSLVQIFFTRNGCELGHVSMEVPPSGFFPTLGTHSKNEKMKVSTNVHQSNVLDRSRLQWRTLTGVEMSHPFLSNQCTLQYLNLPRRVPAVVEGRLEGLSIAVGYKAFSEKLQYFEVEVLCFGKVKAIAIGAVHKNYDAESIPGWLGGSVAYHTDTGHLHYASGKGRQFGPVARVGDVIGCGMSSLPNTKHCNIYFTRNGVPIGHRVQASVPEGGFYPAVGFTSPGDKVSVRFLEKYKPVVTSDLIVGLMRIHNCSYSDNILCYNEANATSTANAQFAVSLNSSRNYFLANVVDLSDSIYIGLATKDYSLKHAPGKSAFSIAYNIQSGKIQGVFGSGDVKGGKVNKCQAGDIVGCGITVSAGSDKTKINSSSAFFTRNRSIVYQVDLPEFYDDLYPIVGFVPMQKQSLIYMDWSQPLFEQQNVL